MKRIALLLLVFAAALAMGCSRKCPPNRACLYINVMSLSLAPDHDQCRTDLKIRGTRKVPAGSETKKPAPGGKHSVVLGPPLGAILTGTTPPSCMHDRYVSDLAPGKWSFEMQFGEEKPIACEVDLVPGPKFNFLVFIKEHRHCGHDSGPDRERD